MTTERRPISDSFHPNWLFVISAFFVLLGIVEVLAGRPLRYYLWAAPWVLACHLFQLFRDYRASDRWYHVMTSPPYHYTKQQFYSQRWPLLLAFLAAPFIGLDTIGILLFALVPIYYFWQRSLYIRSRYEFGSPHKAIQVA